MKRTIIPSVLLVLFAVPSHTLPVTLGPGETALTDSASMWLDADPSTGIDEIRKPSFDSRFSEVAGKQVWTGRASPVTWLRFSISEPPGGTAPPGYDRRRCLEVRPSFSIILDRIDLYLPRSDGGYDRLQAGALVAPKPGEHRSRFFVFDLPPSALEGRTIYLRASSSMDVEFHLSCWDKSALARREGFELGAYGLIFGVLLAMAFYSFFLFASLRDGAYLFYTLYILTAAAWIFMVQGHSRNLLGQHPGLDQSLLWLFAGAMISWGAAFSSAFLRLKGKRPLLFILHMAVCAVSAAAALAGFAGFQRLAFVVTNVLGGVLSFFLIFAAASRIAQGFAPARYFLAAWAILAFSGLSFVLMNLKILPVSFWTVNILPLGMAAESILLSMALADRFRRLQYEKIVLERNQERLRQLSLTDPLTGLHNKRFLLEELEAETERAAHDSGGLSVILLDIDDFKKVNDTWGHVFGDEILVALARAIRASIRDSDRPCRYGGEEFVVIMPGTDLEDAVRAAERIRERFAASSHRPPGCEEVRSTVSLGVASLAPGETPALFLDRVDRAMYAAKMGGKNRTARG